MLQEKASLFKAQNSLAPVTLTTAGTVGGTVIDMLGFNSIFFIVSVGANGGTLDGSNKVEFRLQHADASDLSGISAVSSIGEAGGFTVDTNGAFATIDSAGEASATYKVAYTGNKRYLRVASVVSGTISLPVSIVAFLGDGFAPQV